MLNSIKGATRETYMSTFMSSPEARRDFPDDTLRAAAGYSKWRDLNNGDGSAWEDLDDEERKIMMKVMSEPAKARANAIGQKADTIPMRFIQPGLVRYADVGTVLVRKETLDRMVKSFVGKPVFNETHKEVTSKDFTSGRADGVINRVTWGPPKDLEETKNLPDDGWYWVVAQVWDPETKENCRNGYSVSCAYDVLQWSDEGGITNNIPYEREVLDGDYTHMAVVANPRYEGARIIYNTQGGCMKLAFWRKGKDTSEVRNASEVDTDKAVLEIDGKEVPLKEAIELWNSTKAEEKKKAELANAKMTDDDEIEVGGEKVTVKNLKDAYVLSRKNADDKKKDEKADEEERKNAEADEKKKAEDDEKERKNAEAEEEKKKKDDEERKNAEEKERTNSFENVRNAAADRNGKFESPALMSREDRVAEGAKRYGVK